MNSKPATRRHFLKQFMGVTAAVPLGLGLWPSLSRADLSFSDYKALVCIFLYGGADSANMIVPVSQPDFNLYSTVRGGLGVAQNSLLPISPANSQVADYGFNGSFAPLHPLFESGDMAVVANVGSLVEPVTKAQILAKEASLPPQLFSHSDQQFQWATSISDSRLPIGWGGRIADLFGSVNGSDALSMNVTLAGQSVFLTGQQVVQYALSSEGPEALAIHEFSEPGEPLHDAIQRWLERDYGNMLQREFVRVQNRAISLDQTISTALEQFPQLNTQFPDSELGANLSMAARMIQARDLIGVAPARRQIFLVGAYGWDTHDAQNRVLPGLLANLSSSMAAFNSAMKEIGQDDSVTTFTSSEFGRTLTNNGDGTDHGWGGHQLVLGGSVQGGDIYGTMPDLTLAGPDDAGEGRIIPTLGADQFNATLARWFGVPDADIEALFPNLSRFSQHDLGFM